VLEIFRLRHMRKLTARAIARRLTRRGCVVSEGAVARALRSERSRRVVRRMVAAGELSSASWARVEAWFKPDAIAPLESPIGNAWRFRKRKRRPPSDRWWEREAFEVIEVQTCEHPGIVTASEPAAAGSSRLSPEERAALRAQIDVLERRLAALGRGSR
jgi:hypothetical protein